MRSCKSLLVGGGRPSFRVPQGAVHGGRGRSHARRRCGPAASHVRRDEPVAECVQVHSRRGPRVAASARRGRAPHSEVEDECGGFPEHAEVSFERVGLATPLRSSTHSAAPSPFHSLRQCNEKYRPRSVSRLYRFHPTPRSASAAVLDSPDDAACARAPSSTTTLWVAPS